VDFVPGRSFRPWGSTRTRCASRRHCKLAPFWAARWAGAAHRVALSERGGRLEVEDAGDRVRVLGTAVLRDEISDPAPGRSPGRAASTRCRRPACRDDDAPRRDAWVLDLAVIVTVARLLGALPGARSARGDR